MSSGAEAGGAAVASGGPGGWLAAGGGPVVTAAVVARDAASRTAEQADVVYPINASATVRITSFPGVRRGGVECVVVRDGMVPDGMAPETVASTEVTPCRPASP